MRQQLEEGKGSYFHHAIDGMLTHFKQVCKAVIEPSQALGFQAWLIYEDANSGRARVQAELYNACSSSIRLKFRRARIQT
jgi:hypothetical protein